MDKVLIRETIVKEIEKTKRLIEEYRQLTKPVAPDDAIGRISRMDAINNKSVTEATLRQNEQKLKNLERVYARIDEPNFGMCVKCGNQIPVGRIMIRPDSLLCVKCAK